MQLVRYVSSDSLASMYDKSRWVYLTCWLELSLLTCLTSGRQRFFINTCQRGLSKCWPLLPLQGFNFFERLAMTLLRLLTPTPKSLLHSDNTSLYRSAAAKATSTWHLETQAAKLTWPQPLRNTLLSFFIFCGLRMNVETQIAKTRNCWHVFVLISMWQLWDASVHLGDDCPLSEYPHENRCTRQLAVVCPLATHLITVSMDTLCSWFSWLSYDCACACVMPIAIRT